jgi:hypothetical protein
MDQEVEKFNYITINKGPQRGTVMLSSKDSFFNNDMVYRIELDHIIFKRCDSTYVGKTIKPYIRNTGWRGFMINGEIPIGKYYFSEESDEDKVIVYF